MSHRRGGDRIAYQKALPRQTPATSIADDPAEPIRPAAGFASGIAPCRSSSPNASSSDPSLDRHRPAPVFLLVIVSGAVLSFRPIVSDVALRSAQTATIDVQALGALIAKLETAGPVNLVTAADGAGDRCRERCRRSPVDGTWPEPAGDLQLARSTCSTPSCTNHCCSVRIRRRDRQLGDACDHEHRPAAFWLRPAIRRSDGTRRSAGACFPSPSCRR